MKSLHTWLNERLSNYRSLSSIIRISLKLYIYWSMCKFSNVLGKIKERSLSKENEPDNAVAYSEDDNPQCGEFIAFKPGFRCKA